MKLQDRLEELSFGVTAEYGHSGFPVINNELLNQTLASIKKDMQAIINEPSDTVKKGDTAFTSLEKFRLELRKALEEYIG